MLGTSVRVDSLPNQQNHQVSRGPGHSWKTPGAGELGLRETVVTLSKQFFWMWMQQARDTESLFTVLGCAWEGRSMKYGDGVVRLEDEESGGLM